MTFNAPNLLTLARIFLIPFLVVVLLTSVSEDWFGIGRYALAIVIFLVASLTDILDGYLARRNNQVSKFGALFDPIADKLLISAALIALVEKHLAPAWAVVVILGREFAVTGLRSVAASEGLVIAAQKIGKVKMWAQCVAVVALLVAAANGNPPVSNFGQPVPTFDFWQIPEVHQSFVNLFSFKPTTNDWRVLGYTIGRGALWVAVITSVWSMFDYFKYFFDENRKKESEF
ncbi:MAG: CDP-diacylglycerol--glycerol-3-phosphate 3-phosphatidyltransferase [Pyrinomonadaceae bacterium]|nr:CDP-diacylglycerol--glycerol-3-phosphate 3-phosphatidyltransferase [Pyrinomonadaceae bacterium]MCX7640097.1 CDP-diacylglycerol--glycerol-3-phosphate 3-phosphatidyltransferase [Pyrinomonadaceae bacterium]MDW8304269.1 CDP-diacylglycerol--glycerol-3-phosphate 3-phosphatidyltransferase [Acidobacteriota bacterium]